MRSVLLVLFASALLLLGCAGYGAPQNGTPPAAQPAQPAPQAPAATPPAQIPPSASSASVEISGFAFNPAEIAVAKGAIVTWTNKDSAAHTIASSAFASGTISKGESFSFTFTQAGTYDYYCGIHPSMKGKITVGG